MGRLAVNRPGWRPSPSAAVARLLGTYGLVGLVATAAHWGLLALLVEAGTVPAWLASGAGAVLGAQVAFVGNRWFTFGQRGPAWAQWWRFMLTAMLGGLLGMAIVAALVAAGAHYLLAQAVATFVGLLLTFAVNRRWSFAAPRLPLV